MQAASVFYCVYARSRLHTSAGKGIKPTNNAGFTTGLTLCLNLQVTDSSYLTEKKLFYQPIFNEIFSCAKRLYSFNAIEMESGNLHD